LTDEMSAEKFFTCYGVVVANNTNVVFH
jgi:hypothetical protein